MLLFVESLLLSLFEEFFPVTFRPENNAPAMADRHPSIYASIPTNHVHSVLQNIQTNYGTATRSAFRPSLTIQTQQGSSAVRFNPSSTAPAALFPTVRPTVSIVDPSLSFDPLAPLKEKTLYPSVSPAFGKSAGSNLIDLD